MSASFKQHALEKGYSAMEYILRRLSTLKEQRGMSATIFAVCPNSSAVIRAALRSAKRNNAPIKFTATLNQVDTDGGYTNLTPSEFVKTISLESRKINFSGPVIIAIDHGGPWLKDKHTQQKLSLDETMEAVKKSYEASMLAGYDLIHVDPTVDITLPKGAIIDIDVVAERTIDLISHAENFRRTNNLPQIAYEVGTEEVHGGLADERVFIRFLDLLKAGLAARGYGDTWPCFVVGKVGTDLHTTTFDSDVARQLTKITDQYGSKIKGHYSDNVMNPEEYPRAGMGAANVGPEFTEREYEGLMELCAIENNLHEFGMISKPASLKNVLWDAVISSGRWKKWTDATESKEDFYANSGERQLWFVKTGCRYIWENPEVLAARTRLYENLKLNGLDGEEILLTHIEKAMDKYFHKFNLVDLNDFLVESKM